MAELKDIFMSMADSGHGNLCPVGKLIASFDEETAQAFVKAIESSASIRDIHSELAKAGYKIGRDTLGNHRNKWCRCEGYSNNGTK